MVLEVRNMSQFGKKRVRRYFLSSDNIFIFFLDLGTE